MLKKVKTKNQGADLSKWLNDFKGFFQSNGILWELWVQVGATRNADSSSLQRSFLCRWRWWEGKGGLTSQFIISYTFQPFKQALRNNFQLFSISHTFPALRAFPQWSLWLTDISTPLHRETPLQGPPKFQGELENVKETDSTYLLLIKYWIDKTGHRQHTARKCPRLKCPQCSWLEDQIPGVLECSWSHSTWECVLLIYTLKLHVWEHFLITELRADSPISFKSCGKSLGGNISGEKKKKNPIFKLAHI